MKTVKVLTSSVVLILSSSTLMACPNCFGAKGDPVVESVGWAIMFLLVVILGTLGGIIAFFVNVAKRTQKYEQYLQEGKAEWGKFPELLKD